MDEMFMKLLVGVGSSGVVGFIMWLLLKKSLSDSAEDRKALREAHIAIVTALTARVEAVEKYSKDCEADRTRLWEKLLESNKTLLAHQHKSDVDG